MSLYRSMALALFLTSGCGDHPSTKQCSELFDHYGDLRTREDPRLAGMTAAQKQLMPSVQRAFIGSDRTLSTMAASCAEKLTRAQYQCAVDATSTVAWRNCFE